MVFRQVAERDIGVTISSAFRLGAVAPVHSGKVKDLTTEKAWWATVVYFLLHGFLVSTWISRIPAVKTNLNLSNGLLGLTLLGSAFGAVSSIPIAGILIGRYGSKKVTIGSTVGFCLTLILPGLASNAITLDRKSVV